jgi:hypothetical protein
MVGVLVKLREHDAGHERLGRKRNVRRRIGGFERGFEWFAVGKEDRRGGGAGDRGTDGPRIGRRTGSFVWKR